MSIIQIENLSKSFDNFLAVSNLNLSIDEHKIVGFLGPNGAGKTTTIRMLVGLTKPSSGQILIDGKKVDFNSDTTRKIIGYLPEQPAFYNWMTGQEFLEFVCGIFCISDTQTKKRTKELLDLTNIYEARNKKIGTYSLGMKQRLGIAQALINNPKVLIMDEPVSALDPIGRHEVLSIISKLKAHTTILMSTHILSDVDRICDEIAILNHGKLLTHSTLKELKSSFTSSTINIDFQDKPTSQYLDELRKFPNIASVTVTDNHVVIKCEKSPSSNELLRKISNDTNTVTTYTIAQPNLEELFLKIINSSNHPHE